MKDRTSKYPGRVRLTPVEGQPNVYDREWADEPQQLGTPLNKETLLSDAVAALLRLSQDDPTVNDAFGAIATHFSRVVVENRAPGAEDAGYQGYIWFDTSAEGDMLYSTYICLGQNSAGYIWHQFVAMRKKLKSAVFTASTTWTVPANASGEAQIMVFGGGGGGGCTYSPDNEYAGGGGGGGRMKQWSGVLERGKTYTITVGAGGSGSSVNRNGSNGGSSSFGTIVSATGGNTVGRSPYGGAGGSGGGSGCVYDDSLSGGAGDQFGAGGTVYINSTSVPAGNGVNTMNQDVESEAKGTGEAGANYGGDGGIGGAGGGGGYGGIGGNGGYCGGGGGGGYGISGNGGNGASTDGGYAGAGGIAAGGGGASTQKAPNTVLGGAGGGGVVVVRYYAYEI